jgi:hypothetical protein
MVSSVNTKYWGSRSLASGGWNQQWMDEAESKTADTIASVNGAISSLQSLGSRSLGAATGAIAALGRFKPSAIKIDYKPPAFLSGTFVQAASLGALATDAAPSSISAGAFGTAYTPVKEVKPPKTYKLKVSKLQPITYGKNANPLPKVFIPEKPKPAKPIPGLSVSAFAGDAPAPPDLPKIELILPDLPTIPSYSGLADGALPELPSLQVVAPTGELPGKYVAKAPNIDAILERVRARSLSLASEGSGRWSRAGATLPPGVAGALDKLSGELSGLQHNSVLRSNRMAQEKWDIETLRQIVQFNADAYRSALAAHISYCSQLLEAKKLEAEAHNQMHAAAVSLFNGSVAEFALQGELYKAQLEEMKAPLIEWAASVDVAKAKVTVNNALVKSYVQGADIKEASVEVYRAKVKALLEIVNGKNLEARNMELTAQTTARKLGIFSSKITAYKADLTKFSSEWKKFEARMSAAKSENSVYEALLEADNATASVLGAAAAVSAANAEALGENLKAEASKHRAEYATKQLKNTAEATIAAAQGDVARVKAMVWGVDMQAKEVHNEGLASNARNAARYYEAAASSAHRAADLSMRSILAATQASATALEAAGKTAAAVAQGAFSAVNISESLSASGSISGEWGTSESDTTGFSDTLNSATTYDRKGA